MIDRSLTRRGFLRGAVLRAGGACVALPFLPSLARPAFGAPRAGAPRRTLFVYVPNGVSRPAFTPKAEGALGALPPTLEPLAPFVARLRVLGGLGHAKAAANGDGPGDHARAAATFLTGAQAFKSSASVRAGVSVDQVIAARVGGETMFPSLEVGCDPSGVAGECDSGYSCAYSSHLAWRSPTLPLAKETSPAALFDRLFTDPGGPGTPEEKARRLRRRRSVLDHVLEDAKALAAQAGAEDRRRLDETLDGLRALEARVDRARGNGPAVAGLPARAERPPESHEEHFRLLADLLVAAMQADLTRVATFMVANEGSGRSYPSVGVPDGHHGISHHGGDPALVGKVAKVDRFHVGLLAHLLGALDAVREGDGTLLDATHVVYGSGIGDGNRHDHDDLPLLTVGAPLAAARAGAFTRFPAKTPLCNLFSTLVLDATGAPARVGDATGPL